MSASAPLPILTPKSGALPANPDDAPLADIIRRTEGMLRSGGAAALAASEAPVCACVRAVAKFYGIKPAGPLSIQAGEPTADAIERLARSNGMLARQIALVGDWRQAHSAPLIAKGTDGTLVTLNPQGNHWYVLDHRPGSQKHKLSADDLDAFEQSAWLLSPALPDGVLKPGTLLAFGLSLKRGPLAVFLVLTLIGGLAATLTPIATNVVTSIVVPGRDTLMLFHVAAMLLALLIGATITKFAAAVAMLRMDGAVGSALKVAAADRVIRIMIAEPGKIPSPASATLVSRSVEAWHKATWSQWITVIGAVLVAIPSLFVMTATAPVAALLALALMAGAISFAVWVSKVQLNALFGGPTGQGSWIGSAYEALSGIETVRAFDVQSRMFTRFSTSLMELKARFLRADRIGTLAKVLEAVIEAFIVLVGIGTILVLYRTMPSSGTAGFMMALMTVTGAATATVHALLNAVMLGLQKKLILPVFEGKPVPAIGGARPPVLTGAIHLNDVSYQHDPKAAPVLDGVTLSIQPGEHIGIAGPSGSGKSTLLNVLLGLVKPVAGHVQFDGVDLDDLDGAAVRRQIGVVGQALGLFPGTIFENIAVGTPITQDTAWEALENAAMADDVRAMPLGLSTLVSDADAVLSRGQIQRILLARAMVHRPRILILDEATSALDPVAEAHVTRAFDGLKATVISVAHRLDTLAQCDRIYVLEAGRVVEHGSFSQLLAGGGVFAGMAAAEARAAEGGEPANPVHRSHARLARALSRPKA